MPKPNRMWKWDKAPWRAHHVGAEFRLMGLLFVCAVILGILASSGATEKLGASSWFGGGGSVAGSQ